MSFSTFAKALAPLAVIAAAAAAAACSSGEVRINGDQGKPLAELDLSGTAPRALALMGPDHVRISSGPTLSIKVDGDHASADLLRFTLKDGTLGIRRDKGGRDDSRKVTVNVTMPAPEQLTLAGSGTIEASAVARNATITIAGSGSVTTPAVEIDKLEVTIAGSGSYAAGGRASNLALTIAGSGNGEMADLIVQDAQVTIAGSGRGRFASDGTVKGKIMGSGEVRVRGRARCEVQSMGSGRLICKPETAAAA